MCWQVGVLFFRSRFFVGVLSVAEALHAPLLLNMLLKRNVPTTIFRFLLPWYEGADPLSSLEHKLFRALWSH